MPTVDYDQMQALAMEWGPRVAAALVILIVAHFLAKGAQWALARLIDALPGVRKHNEGSPPKETAGYQLGQLAYWLVLLIGVIGALTVLGLSSIVAPLNALLFQVMAFIPNLVGAAVIFFVGLVVATLARRVVEAALNAAHVDGWLERAGLKRMTGASGLAKTAGVLVFVLIVIPVTIAALQQLGVRAISDPAVAVLSTVLDALPRILAAAIILALAFFIGRWVASLLEQILPSLGFDSSLQALGIGSPPAEPPPVRRSAAIPPSAAPPPAAPILTPSKIVARGGGAAAGLRSDRHHAAGDPGSRRPGAVRWGDHHGRRADRQPAGRADRPFDGRRGGPRAASGALGDHCARHRHGPAVHGAGRRDRCSGVRPDTRLGGGGLGAGLRPRRPRGRQAPDRALGGQG
jgi:hypothetical protein